MYIFPDKLSPFLLLSLLWLNIPIAKAQLPNPPENPYRLIVQCKKEESPTYGPPISTNFQYMSSEHAQNGFLYYPPIGSVTPIIVVETQKRGSAWLVLKGKMNLIHQPGPQQSITVGSTIEQDGPRNPITLGKAGKFKLQTSLLSSENGTITYVTIECKVDIDEPWK